MTRARLIEAAIVAWFEKDGWSYNPETGEIVFYGPPGHMVMNLTALAAHLDFEWDRLSAGTA